MTVGVQTNLHALRLIPRGLEVYIQILNSADIMGLELVIIGKQTQELTIELPFKVNLELIFKVVKLWCFTFVIMLALHFDMKPSTFFSFIFLLFILEELCILCLLNRCLDISLLQSINVLNLFLIKL